MSASLPSLALVAGLLAACVATAAVLRRRQLIGGEASRKLVHIGMGLICAAFPWLFHSSGPVFLIAGIACAVIVTVNRIPTLAPVLRDIDRSSEGEFYFPLGVALCFHFSRGEPALYCPPILMLALADALAALMGKRFGRARFTTGEGYKTWEGSLAFVLAASLTTAITLLFVSSEPLHKILLIALLLGLVGAMLEAVAWRGLDNLLLPLVGLIAMAAYIDLSPAQLLGRILALAAFAAIAFALKRRSTMNDAALLGAALILYLAWAQGGWLWALPPLLVLFLFPSVVEFDYDAFRDFQSVSSLLCINLVPFAWLGQSIRGGASDELYWPYAAAYATHLSLIWSKRAKLQGWRFSLGSSIAAFALLSTFAIQALPAAIAHRFALVSPQLTAILATLLLVFLASALAATATPFLGHRPGLAKREWALHCALATLTSLTLHLAT